MDQSPTKIGQHILFVRGHRVMLDRDLAVLYRVKPIALRQQVKRNPERFPADFMFKLSQAEAESLVSQSVIPSLRSLGGSLPYVFTQEGVAMLSSVLRSDRAAQVNVAVMRAFVRVREVLATHSDLAKRLEQAECRLADHDTAMGEHAKDIRAVFEAIRQLIEPSRRRRPRIGFKP